MLLDSFNYRQMRTKKKLTSASDPFVKINLMKMRVENAYFGKVSKGIQWDRTLSYSHSYALLHIAQSCARFNIALKINNLVREMEQLIVAFTMGKSCVASINTQFTCIGELRQKQLRQTTKSLQLVYVCVILV